MIIWIGFHSGLALTKEQIVECSLRYVSLCEMVTGERFAFPSTAAQLGQGSCRQRLVQNLVGSGYLSHGCVFIMAGSDSDLPHITAIQDKVLAEVEEQNETFKEA